MQYYEETICMKPLFIKSAAILVLTFLSISAAMLPLPSTLTSVSTPYDTILLKTWQGIKKRMIDPYAISLVHRPKSEEPHDAVSEGVGYGMLLALYCNDQTYFNKIWDAAEQYMWTGEYYNWRVDKDGVMIGSGAATDAEQDIALALIFANALVEKKIWSAHTSSKKANYNERAQTIINSIWNTMVEDGRYVRPGSGWGGRAFVNPGYFAPAFYRVFDEFETTDHNWESVIDQCYLIVAASPGYKLGMTPDWMTPSGGYSSEEQLGYNAYLGGKSMYKDGIRILWRLATDCAWYGDMRAEKFLRNALFFVKQPAAANFFQMDGSVVPETFTLGNGVSRPRAEHSHLTVGMWATAAYGALGAAGAETYSKELLSFYTAGSDFWGHATDAGNEDTLHNEMYFDQFLAWFGASLISGVFTNLYEDCKDPDPTTPPSWRVKPVLTPLDLNADKEPFTIKAVLSKPVRWSVSITKEVGDSATIQFSGSGDTIDLQWYGLSAEGTSMPQGYYTVVITVRGMLTPIRESVWLGRPRDLKSGNRLIIDDFNDGDLKPFFGGGWGSYTEQSDGKNGSTAIKVLAVQRENSTSWLHWGYTLNGKEQIGFNPYAALEWNGLTASGNFDLSGLDTLIFTAKAVASVKVSVQLITTDIGDYTYFEDSITITPTQKEFCLPVTAFKQRLGGSGQQLNLNKCNSIRFQVQDVDGTSNEIALKEVFMSGTLANLYQSPPPYIPAEPKENSVITKQRHSRSSIVTHTHAAVTFRVPQSNTGTTLTIVSLAGRTIVRYTSKTDQNLVWNFTDKNGKIVQPGSYRALLRTKITSEVIPINFIP